MESKRGATRTVDDIVCPLVKAKEYIWKRYIRNTRGKHAVASSHVENQHGWNESCLPAWQEVWSYGTQRYTVQDIIDGNSIPLRSVNGNDVVPNRVKHVWPVGEAEVFTVTDEFGNRVSATANHRILTPDGYKELQHLSIGDKIAHNGLPAYTDSVWLGKMCKTHTTKEIAAICDVSDRTIHGYKKKFGLSTKANNGKLWADEKWLTQTYRDQNHTLVETASMAGCSTHTIRKYAARFGIQKDHIQVLKDYVADHGTFIPNTQGAFDRAQKAKDARRANFPESITWSGDGWNYRKAAFEQGWSRCFYCDNEIDEIHHRDRNRDNNEIDNLLGLCSGHHYLIHGKRPTVFGYGVIISIESAGVHPVYDIEMELEDNFVAGGVIVHNSRRYVTENEEFYVPAQFLGAPENKKQGAGDPINDHTNLTFKKQLADHQQEGLELYSQAMDAGIAPEQARLFLPAYGLYIRWRWTVSLNALMHFLDQRLDDHAQFEIRQYAKAIEPMVKEKYPMVCTAWVESRR